MREGERKGERGTGRGREGEKNGGYGEDGVRDRNGIRREGGEEKGEMVESKVRKRLQWTTVNCGMKRQHRRTFENKKLDR